MSSTQTIATLFKEKNPPKSLANFILEWVSAQNCPDYFKAKFVRDLLERI